MTLLGPGILVLRRDRDRDRDRDRQRQRKKTERGKTRRKRRDKTRDERRYVAEELDKGSRPHCCSVLLSL